MGLNNKEGDKSSLFSTPRWERLGVALPEKLYSIEISSETREKITTLQTRLQSEGNITTHLILYFNHVAYDDPVFALYVARLIDPKNSRKLILPSSKWHTEWKNNPAFATATLLGKLFYGVEMVPVVQTYMINDAKYGYTEQDAHGSYKHLMQTLKRLLNQRRVLSLILSPEGHRSDGGALGKIEPGMLKMGEILAPVLFCPLGIEYPDGFSRDVNVRPFIHRPRVRLTLGELTFQPDRKTKVSVNTLIGNLAHALPEHMRGAWG